MTKKINPDAASPADGAPDRVGPEAEPASARGGDVTHWLPAPGDPWNDALLELQVRRRVGDGAAAAVREQARQQILAEEATMARDLSAELRRLREAADDRTRKQG